MDDTPNLALPYIAPQQAQKHVTHNEAIRALDALVQLSVIDRTRTNPPEAPVEGARYLVAAPAGGAWANWEGRIAAFQDGAWLFHAPRAGWRAWCEAERALITFDGDAWVATGGALLGVNATADATNRLTVSAPATLLNNEGAGHQLKINKAASGDTASLLYQTAFSGRAEMGLAGNDDFSIKVSPDGATFHDAIAIDKDTGNVGIGQAAPTARLHLSGDDGTTPDVAGDVDFDKQGGGFFLLMLSSYTGATGNGSAFSVQRKARGTRAVPADVEIGDRLGGFSFRGYKDGAWRQTGLIDCLIDAATGFASIPSAMTFRTGSNGVAERMRITSSGLVGIATAAPVCALDVNGPVRVASYAKASLPSAAAGAGQIIYVTDEAGGATIAFSDGAAWRRVSDRAVVA